VDLQGIDPARIGFDFDGVIADTAEAFIRLAKEQYGLDGFSKKDITSFAVEECLDIETDIVEAIFTDIMLDSVGSGLRPMDGAVEVLGEFSAQAELTVITARPEPEPVQAWLETFLPPATSSRIHVIAMGAHDSKSAYIKQQGLTHFIDDRAETCTQLNRDGIRPIVFHQPWNHQRHNLSTVRNWEEIRSLCRPPAPNP